jgi:hypothetical protein
MLIPATAEPPIAARATATSNFLVTDDFITTLLLGKTGLSGAVTGPVYFISR